MASRFTLKDHFRESSLFNVRAIAALIFSVILILVIILRLLYLQITEHELYSTLSENNRFQINAVPPNRGLIYDRNGVLLAQNLPSYELQLLPEQIEDMDGTIASLSTLINISEADIRRFKKQLRRNRPFKPIALRSRLSDEEMARIAVNRHLYPGVDIAAKLIRHYPQGKLAVHAIGYVGRINEKEQQLVDKSNYDGTDFIGKTGIEKYYEDILHGNVGVSQVEINAVGRTLRTIEQVPSEAGLNLHLTLDAGMQHVAEEALGDYRGSIVAIDPNNGNVLVLASMPGYDPNLFVTGIDIKTYKALRNDDNIPLFNRALRGRYPPGSTVKPFVALGGLETGSIDKDKNVNCTGKFYLPGSRHKYRDWKKGGHGETALSKGIIQSCDVYFYSLARTMGITKLSRFMKLFGFGRKTGVDISGELAGLMPSIEWKKRARHEPWYPGETVITGIGQGYTLITPIQLASSMATLSVYGRREQPRIVSHIKNIGTGEKHEIPPSDEESITIINRDNWVTVLKAMKNVIHHWRGTARRIGKGAKYTIGGKTGTAQVFSVKQEEEYDEENVAEKLRDHALFIAFAPVEDPRIAVAVIVENGGHGGSVAAPMARKVMDYYLLPEIEAAEKEQEKLKQLEAATQIKPKKQPVEPSVPKAVPEKEKEKEQNLDIDIQPAPGQQDETDKMEKNQT